MKNDPEPLDALREMLVRLVRQYQTEITMTRLAALLTCYSEEQPQAVRSMAAHLAVSKSIVSRSVDWLEEFKLVKRVPEPGDRRSVVMDRTSTGRALMAKLRG